jgi:hypothetical protein
MSFQAFESSVTESAMMAVAACAPVLTLAAVAL